MKRVAVLVSGRGSNLAAVLDAQKRGELPSADICCVLSNVAEVKALDIATVAKIEALTLPHQNFPSREAFDERLVATLKERAIDYVLLAGFMRLLSPVMIGAFRHRILNVHPSLLPAFPGAHAVRDALAYGARLSGCTVHLVDEGTDTGPIVLQESVVVLDSDSEESLHARIQKIEHQLVPRALELLCAGKVSVDGRKVRIS